MHIASSTKPKQFKEHRTLLIVLTLNSCLGQMIYFSQEELPLHTANERPHYLPNDARPSSREGYDLNIDFSA